MNLYTDKRLRPVARLINHAVRLLKAGDGVGIGALIPPELRNEFPAEAAREILTGLGIARLDARKYYKTKLSRAQFRRAWRGLHVYLWEVTSRAYSEGGDIFESRAALESILKLFAVPEALHDGLRNTLRHLGIAEKRAGGLGIAPRRSPAPGRPGELVVIEGGRSTSPSRGTSLPEGLREAGRELRGEIALYPEVLAFFAAGRQHRRDDGRETAGWKYLFAEHLHGRTRMNDWENPDLAGLRIETGALNLPDIELLAVEVKDSADLRKEFIAQAESYFEYANFVYLVLNGTEKQVREKPRNLERLIARGIGLLLRDPDGGFRETVAPVYHACRRSKSLARIEKLFPRDIEAIRAEIHAAYRGAARPIARSS